MSKVKCLLCPRECELRSGQRGNCRARMNIEGRLKTLVYGKPCSVHVDPIEKKPLFHYLPGTGSFSIATAGCNLHCKYCQNWEISQREPENTRNIDLSPQEVINKAIDAKCRTIAYTYSDPIIFFEYAADTGRLAHKNGLLNVWVTAGYINPEPLKEALTFVDAANIDLKGMTEDFYRTMSGGTLRPVLNTIKTMKDRGVWVEITNLVVPTYNDTREDFSKLSGWIADNVGVETPLHFSKFWPMYQLKNLPPTPEDVLTRAREIAMSKGIQYVYVGNIPGHDGNNTYCPVCKKIVIARRGYMILEYNIVNGKCRFCNHRIPGKWE
ncbi:MAG: AmmeMemoRadiSam system radical SAM enzyme [Candidatus Omnitrophica bacterium]|nr:AmmeMemoRadiSam system radical SAM enzyme [Candidatus Omnitrophota bacterium]MBU4149493.1 AmmeMemoRadiSam system radical SAM enzyme [Candidatus Omnitrophota bacterium]